MKEGREDLDKKVIVQKRKCLYTRFPLSALVKLKKNQNYLYYISYGILTTTFVKSFGGAKIFSFENNTFTIVKEYLFYFNKRQRHVELRR